MAKRVMAVFGVLLLWGFGAQAQDVDRFDLKNLEDKIIERLAETEAELELLRNAVSGDGTAARFETLEGEIQRLTAAVEKLEFDFIQYRRESKNRLDDFEYRIIVLEGGDPSVLFQTEEEPTEGDGAEPLGGQNAENNPAPAPGTAEGTEGASEQTGVLGELKVDQSGAVVGASAAEQATFTTGVNLAQNGHFREAAVQLEDFVNDYPDSDNAGEAYYWLGESYLVQGDYQTAASRFLDSTTLYRANPKAAEAMARLGVSLVFLGQNRLACKTFDEVGKKYPVATAAIRMARDEASRAGCQ